MRLNWGNWGIYYWMLTFSVWRCVARCIRCVGTRTTLAGWQKGLNSIKSVQMHLFKLILWHTDTLHRTINNWSHFYYFHHSESVPIHRPVSHIRSETSSWMLATVARTWNLVFFTRALYHSFVYSACFLKLIIVGQTGPNAHAQSVSVTTPPPVNYTHLHERMKNGHKLGHSCIEDNRFCDYSVCFSDFFIITAAVTLRNCRYNVKSPHEDTHKIVSFSFMACLNAVLLYNVNLLWGHWRKAGSLWTCSVITNARNSPAAAPRLTSLPGWSPLEVSCDPSDFP